MSDVGTMYANAKALHELLQESRAENERLQDENERLRSCLSDSAENSKQIMHEAHVQEEENAKLRERIKELEECIRGDAEGIYRLAKNTGYLHTDELMKSVNNHMRELGIEVDA